MSSFDLPLQPNLLWRRIVEPSIVNNHVICIHGMYTRWPCFHDIFRRESQISERVYPIRDRRDSAAFLNEFRHRILFTRKNLHAPMSTREHYMHTYDNFSQFLFQVPRERKTCIFGLLSFPHATPFPLPRNREAAP